LSNCGSRPWNLCGDWCRLGLRLSHRAVGCVSHYARGPGTNWAVGHFRWAGSDCILLCLGDCGSNPWGWGRGGLGLRLSHGADGGIPRNCLRGRLSHFRGAIRHSCGTARDGIDNSSIDSRCAPLCRLGGQRLSLCCAATGLYCAARGLFLDTLELDEMTGMLVVTGLEVVLEVLVETALAEVLNVLVVTGLDVLLEVLVAV